MLRPLVRRTWAPRGERFVIEWLPAYAPDLNPVEMIWSYLKYDHMANFVPRDVHEVGRVVRGHLEKLGKGPKRIRGLGTGSRLPLVNENLAT